MYRGASKDPTIDIISKQFLKKKNLDQDSRSLNKIGEFNLTDEIKERKKREWWARFKYKYFLSFIMYLGC